MGEEEGGRLVVACNWWVKVGSCKSRGLMPAHCPSSFSIPSLPQGKFWELVLWYPRWPHHPREAHPSACLSPNSSHTKEVQGWWLHGHPGSRSLLSFWLIILRPYHSASKPPYDPTCPLELQPSHPNSRWKTGGREKSTKEGVSHQSGLPLRSFPRRLSWWFLLASHDHLFLQGRLENDACHLAHGSLCCGPAYVKVPCVWTSACSAKPSSNLCSI